MIGHLPRYRPKQARRTLTYTPKWSRSHARRAEAVNNGNMLFDRRSELPVATARLRSRTWPSLTARLRGELALRWQWLRPRLVPVIVAAASMFALLGATNYLSNLARKTPPHTLAARIENRAAQPARPPVLRIENGPVGAHVILDGRQTVQPIQLAPLR
jgi:hypothetical protein